MEIKLEIPEYDKNEGFKYSWENGFEIKIETSNNDILIIANKAGLISMARQLLTLAQDKVPDGYHFDLDEYGGLEDGSKALIIQKI